VKNVSKIILQKASRKNIHKVTEKPEVQSSVTAQVTVVTIA
jgi:hypothetical protein